MKLPFVIRHSSFVIACNEDVQAANDSVSAGVFSVLDGGALFVPFGAYPQNVLLHPDDARKARALGHRVGTNGSAVATQLVDAQAANDMAADLTGLIARAMRGFKHIAVYNGHPYHPDPEKAKAYSDRRAYGWVKEISAANDGVRMDVDYTTLGTQAVNEGWFAFHSPQWDMRIVRIDADGIFCRPYRLRSGGLTNEPNIPVPPIVAANEDSEAANAFDPLKHDRDEKGRWATKQAGEIGSLKGGSARRGEMRDATEDDLKKLKIPPRREIEKDGKTKVTGYTDVTVTDDPNSDVLARGTNPAGEVVDFYAPKWRDKKDAQKWARISAFNREQPRIVKQINDDITAGGEDAEHALAARVMMRSGLRVGGEDGGGKVPAYGATSLRTSHATVDGEKVHLDFIGKKGVRQRHTITDPDFTALVKTRQAAGAEKIFNTDDGKVCDYMNKVGGNKFKVHDLRTWNGTTLAAAAVKKLKAKGITMPEDEKGRQAFKLRVASIVGRQLGNDAKMSLGSYIHPLVFDLPVSGGGGSKKSLDDQPLKKAA